MSALLTVEALSYVYESPKRWLTKPKVFKLAPVSFTVQKGETVAIVGENGSGKSLLAEMIVGLKQPHSGDIYLNGQLLHTDNIKQRCLNIRMIFQHSDESLNPGITIGSILDEPLKLNTQLTHADRQIKILETLALVGLLPEHAYFYKHMLSDGQRQRVALARALILNPQIIVADEPFAALDPSVRSQQVNLIMRLQKELGLAFVFISHNLGIVRHISDRVLVMKEGEVIESGKTEVVFTWPKNEYTQRLVNSHQNLVNNPN